MQGITPDGLALHNRVLGSTNEMKAAKVVDNILTPATLYSRLIGKGKKFTGMPQDFTIKVTHDSSGEFYSGMPTFSAAAQDTRITMSYTPAAFEQPIVLPMLESFENAVNPAFDLDQSKTEEGVDDAIYTLGTYIYGTGAGDQPNGLGNIVLDSGTIGGQSRTTYTALNAQVNASGGTISLSKMATLHDDCSLAGVSKNEPTFAITTKAVWSLIEQLYTPFLQGSYNEVGYLPVRGDSMVASKAKLSGHAGFTAIDWRGIPITKDEHCTSGYFYLLNENYLEWRGLTQVPTKWKGQISPVNLGEPSVVDGVRIAPSKYHGWFFQDFQVMPNQPGMVARYHVFGQLMTSQPRTQGVLTGITGV